MIQCLITHNKDNSLNSEAEKRREIMKKKFGVMLVGMLMLGSLSGCGEKETVETTTEVSTEVTTEATTEATTEEPEVVGYSEENGLVFSETIDAETPTYSYYKDEAGNISEECDGVKVVQGTATYKLGDIECSEVDDEGYVIYKIPYTYKCEVGMILPGDVAAKCPEVQCSTIGLFDYYTGICAPDADIKIDEGDSEKGFDYSTEFEYEGKTYDIYYSVTATMDEGSWNQKEVDEGLHVYKFLTHSMVITVKAPEDYDGLCLYLSTEGKTSYKELNEEVDDSEQEKLLDDGKTASNFICVRVSDLLQK